MNIYVHIYDAYLLQTFNSLMKIRWKNPHHIYNIPLILLFILHIKHVISS